MRRGAVRGRAETFATLHAFFRNDLERKTAKWAVPRARTPAEALRRELLLLCAADSDLREAAVGWDAISEGRGFLLRGLRWRVCLGSLSRDCRSWACDLSGQRDEYTRFRSQLVTSALPATMPTDDRAKAEAQLRKEVDEDVIRTYPDNEFFQREDVRGVMSRVLCVYATLHPQLQYVQGMNEIVAPIVHVLHTDYVRVCEMFGVAPQCVVPPQSSQPLPSALPSVSVTAASVAELTTEELKAIAAETTRVDFLEHDTYWLFSQLMDTIGEWFHSPKSASSSSAAAAVAVAVSDVSSSTPPPSQQQSLSPEMRGPHMKALLSSIEQVKVVGKCLQIQALLTLKDPELSRYLLSLDIQPQLYMLRWVRILMSQVFPLEDLLLMWDVIFAIGPPFTLIDHICVALLLLARAKIIGEDYSTVLDLLFHYPRSMNPPSLIISIAVNSMRSLSTPFFSNSMLPPPYLQVPSLFPRQVVAAPAPQQQQSSATTYTLPTSSSSAPPQIPSSVPSPKSPFSLQQQQQQQREKRREGWSLARPATLMHVSAAPMSHSSKPHHATPQKLPPSPPPPPPPRQQQLTVPSPRRAATEMADLSETAAGETMMLERLTAIQASNVHAANRLDRVIFMLNALSGNFTAQNGLTFRLAITELEQVKDELVVGVSGSRFPLSPGPGIGDAEDSE